MPERARPGSPYFAGAPLLIAHRGGGGLAPENTIEAFRRAVEWWRADVLELDVRLTRDGEAVVFHDATLDRTTDGRGRVSEHRLSEIRRLDAGARFAPAGGGGAPFRGRGVRVPTLEEVLRTFPVTRINIEIKDVHGAPRVLESVREARAEQRVLIAAGERAARPPRSEWPHAVSAAGEEVRRFLIHHRLRALRWHRCDVDALQVPERQGRIRIVTPRFVRDAHRSNLPVHVWTVDEEADMRRLLDWGVDGIVTDRPDRLARVLHEARGRLLPPGPAPATG